MAGVSSLFLAGVAFGYFVVLPVALNFLLGFGGDAFHTQVRAGEYFGFVTTLLLGVGAACSRCRWRWSPWPGSA